MVNVNIISSFSALGLIYSGVIVKHSSVVVVFGLLTTEGVVGLWSEVGGVVLHCNPWFWWDQLSSVIVFLSFVVGLMAFLSSEEHFGDLEFSVVLYSSVASSVVFFISSSLLGFFVFFEATLVPLIVLILGWGHQPERMQACVSLIVYTSFGSLPLFSFFSWVLKCSNSFSFQLVQVQGWELAGYLWMLIMLGFFVKLPLFGVHGWLPKAHVESPAAGSIMLSGVLLKFGIYGIMRIIRCFKWAGGGYMVEALMAASLWGGVVSSIICLVQSDLNSLIAYSSISHMSLTLVGVISCSSVGWSAAILIAVGHGLSSPILFSLSNYIFRLYGSRNLMVCNGLLKFCPGVAFVMFVGCALNAGVPPSLSFFSEALLLSSALSWCWLMCFPIVLVCFISIAYSMFLYSSINHGGSSVITLSFLSCGLSGVSLLGAEYAAMVLSFTIDILVCE